MIALAMENFRDQQLWKEARVLTAILHLASDSLPPKWALRFRRRAVGLLAALTNPNRPGSTRDAKRLCDTLKSELSSAYEHKLIDRVLFDRLKSETTHLSTLLRQDQQPQRTIRTAKP